MKKIHIALGVSSITRSVKDYSRRLGCKPVSVVPHEYALWRTPQINFSIRQVQRGAGSLRHLGWEDSAAFRFSKDSDCNGIIWERFSATLQAEEIKETWPESCYKAGPTRRSSGRGPRSGPHR